ncbi:PREDICTED: gibberellin 2-beta-dioxygenase 8-like [Populus euphratica]|uniref:Gibberellin 2-beta-dioxygenase 8-like n=1 Tax=Populus euphratica TaxID=75702 RepID=A0AAJ6VIA5_POPEU|nr:PREDICTED: gibberellin 2-beta-dioxygenase 8-like [Populus euphratica]
MDPPFQETYKSLFNDYTIASKDKDDSLMNANDECELPLIDLHRLTLEYSEKEQCVKEIKQAASEWGFLQVINHGIPQEILKSLQYEQRKAFQHPFRKKAEDNFLNLSAKSYRWGNPRATCLRQLSWSEAFHVALTDISRIGDAYKSLSASIKAFTTKANALAKDVAEILAENLGVSSTFFEENCPEETSYLRMNRYPPCPFSSEVFGLIPHTDSSFLTVLNQNQIGGLQLLKNGRWINVKPNPEALVINIGDLFQVLSNDVYKSIKHRVLAPQQVERFSLAFFYCPTSETVIESSIKPSKYKEFTFREYKTQIQRDLEATGDKVGVSRFLL